MPALIVACAKNLFLY